MTTPEYDDFIRDLERQDALVVDGELLIGSTLDDDELAIRIFEIVQADKD